MGRLRRGGLAAGALLTVGVAVWALWSFGVVDPRPPPPPAPPPAPMSSPAGPMTLGVLGTSLSHDEPWPEEAAAALARCRGAPVAAIVVARPGGTSLWGLAALERLLERKPDLVLIEFAINDAALVRGVTLARSRRAVETILDRVTAAGATPALLTSSGAHGFEALERPGLGAYVALYRRIATERGVRLIDLAPLWNALSPEVAARALPDGLHPTPDAVRAVAQPALVEALERIACPAARD